MKRSSFLGFLTFLLQCECDGELEKTRRAREKKIMNKKIKKGKRKKNKKKYLIDI
jgi:hypothetical protein